jgi:hypothetical protein
MPHRYRRAHHLVCGREGVVEETLQPRLADPFPLAHGAMAQAVAPPLAPGPPRSRHCLTRADPGPGPTPAQA